MNETMKDPLVLYDFINKHVWKDDLDKPEQFLLNELRNKIKDMEQLSDKYETLICYFQDIHPTVKDDKKDLVLMMINYVNTLRL